MKMKMNMQINKALIACSKNVIALATLVLRSLTITASQVHAIQVEKHSILGSTLRQRELGLPSSCLLFQARTRCLFTTELRFTFYVLLLHCCRRQHNNVPWFAPWYVVRRQLGCIYSRVSNYNRAFLLLDCKQFEPCSPEGTSAVYSGQRESRDSRRGEGNMVHTNWLASEK